VLHHRLSAGVAQLIVGPYMLRANVSLLLVVTALASCTTDADRERREFNSAFYWRHRSRLEAPVSAENLCADASNSTMERRLRCLSVFAAFASYVKPGFSSLQMRAALPDTLWLQDCTLERIRGVGGSVDFDWFSGAPFCLRVCPDTNGWSDWVIDFTLTHEEGYSRGIEDGLAFLKGTLTNRQVRLAEFVLHYPVESSLQNGNVMLSERFTRKGVGLIVHP